MKGDPKVELEVQSEKDSAWYAAKVEIHWPTLKVEFEDFPGDDEHLFGPEDVKKRVRLVSSPLEDSECKKAKASMIVCVMLKRRTWEKYFDAVIVKIERRVHKIVKRSEVCNCIFIVKWLEGPEQGTKKVVDCKDICLLSSGDVCEHATVHKYLNLLKEREALQGARVSVAAAVEASDDKQPLEAQRQDRKGEHCVKGTAPGKLQCLPQPTAMLKPNGSRLVDEAQQEKAAANIVVQRPLTATMQVKTEAHGQEPPRAEHTVPLAKEGRHGGPNASDTRFLDPPMSEAPVIVAGHYKVHKEGPQAVPRGTGQVASSEMSDEVENKPKIEHHSKNTVLKPQPSPPMTGPKGGRTDGSARHLGGKHHREESLNPEPSQNAALAAAAQPAPKRPKLPILPAPRPGLTKIDRHIGTEKAAGFPEKLKMAQAKSAAAVIPPSGSSASVQKKQPEVKEVQVEKPEVAVGAGVGQLDAVSGNGRGSGGHDVCGAEASPVLHRLLNVNGSAAAALKQALINSPHDDGSSGPLGKWVMPTQKKETGDENEVVDVCSSDDIDDNDEEEEGGGAAGAGRGGAHVGGTSRERGGQNCDGLTPSHSEQAAADCASRVDMSRVLWFEDLGPIAKSLVEKGCVICVANLDLDLTQDQFKDAFKVMPCIRRDRVLQTRVAARHPDASTAFGFGVFRSQEAADVAVARLIWRPMVCPSGRPWMVSPFGRPLEPHHRLWSRARENAIKAESLPMPASSTSQLLCRWLCSDDAPGLKLARRWEALYVEQARRRKELAQQFEAEESALIVATKDA
eukprot:jgi/Mesen1/7051/ME000369S06374